MQWLHAGDHAGRCGSAPLGAAPADQRRKRSPGPQGLLAKAALVGLGAVLEKPVQWLKQIADLQALLLGMKFRAMPLLQ